MKTLAFFRLMMTCLAVAVISLTWVALLIYANYDYMIRQQATEQETFVCGTSSADENLLTNEPDTTQKFLMSGKELFKNNCHQCHAFTEEVVVGPGLKNIAERRSEKWLLLWIKNPVKMLESKDKYATDLFKKYNQAQMPSFKQLKDEEIKAILAYIAFKNK
ncbi:MAG: cytochrome c [Verrucomicrobia bacterium]|nr:cytochrome c [Cytophagales bacterium]